MTLRKPLTLMHDDTQVPDFDRRRAPRFASRRRSSAIRRSDADPTPAPTPAAGPGRTTPPHQSSPFRSPTPEDGPTRETRLTDLATRRTPTPAADSQPWCIAARPRNLSLHRRRATKDSIVEYVNSLRNRLRRTTQSAIVYPKLRGLLGRIRPDRHTHHRRGSHDGTRRGRPRQGRPGHRDRQRHQAVRRLRGRARSRLLHRVRASSSRCSARRAAARRPRCG